MITRTTPRAAALAVALAVTLALPATASAKAESLDGAVRVVNDRVVPVALEIDGKSYGTVGPRSKRIVKGVPNGVRLVRLASSGLSDTLEQVPVPIDGLAEVRLAPVYGSLKVVNDSGVAMRVDVDGHRVGKVGPGKRFEWGPVLPGRHQLVARPVANPYKAGPAMKHGFAVKAGNQSRVVLKPWLATLEIFNPMPSQAAVYVEGIKIGEVRGRQALVIAGQVPGKTHVALKRRGAVRAQANLNLSPGQRTAWRPEIRLEGAIQVTNQSSARVALELDGAPIATISPGQARMLQGVTVGSRQLLVRFGDGRQVFYDVKVADGAITPVVLTSRRPAPRKVTSSRTWKMKAKAKAKKAKVKKVLSAGASVTAGFDVGAVIHIHL